VPFERTTPFSPSMTHSRTRAPPAAVFDWARRREAVEAAVGGRKVGYVEGEIRVVQSDSSPHYGCRLRTTLALGDEIHQTEHWQRYAQGRDTHPAETGIRPSAQRRAYCSTCKEGRKV
jgi:hypothetical protein